MLNPYQSCIQSCYACAEACDTCAAACLQESDPNMLARCIELDNECAALCRLACQYMSRQSPHTQELCQLCATICEACGDECARHSHSHCQECAQACRACADECRRMSSGLPQGRQPGLGATAH
jgi:hypothetical protein